MGESGVGADSQRVVPAVAALGLFVFRGVELLLDLVGRDLVGRDVLRKARARRSHDNSEDTCQNEKSEQER